LRTQPGAHILDPHNQFLPREMIERAVPAMPFKPVKISVKEFSLVQADQRAMKQVIGILFF
jgi:hypothetical protein